MLQGRSDDALLPPPALTLPLKRLSFLFSFTYLFANPIQRALLNAAPECLLLRNSLAYFFNAAPVSAQIRVAYPRRRSDRDDARLFA